MGIEIPSDVLDALEERVADVEKTTSAEVVVVIAGRSGHYRDAALATGAAIAVLTLILMIYLPVDIPASLVAPLSVLAGLLGLALGHRVPRLQRWFTMAERRAAQVEDGAKVAFVDEAVSATRERTGVLVYFSMLEDRVEVRTDHGVDAHIPRGAWNALVVDAVAAAGPGQWQRTVEEVLDRAKPLLAEHLPAGEDNPDQIPNRPRVLP